MEWSQSCDVVPLYCTTEGGAPSRKPTIHQPSPTQGYILESRFYGQLSPFLLVKRLRDNCTWTQRRESFRIKLWSKSFISLFFFFCFSSWKQKHGSVCPQQTLGGNTSSVYRDWFNNLGLNPLEHLKPFGTGDEDCLYLDVCLFLIFSYPPHAFHKFNKTRFMNQSSLRTLLIPTPFNIDHASGWADEKFKATCDVLHL